MSADRLHTKVEVISVEHDVSYKHVFMLHRMDKYYAENIQHLESLNGQYIESVTVTPALHPKLGEWKALVAEGHTTKGFDDWLIQCGGNHG